MPAGIFLVQAELHALRGLPHPAIALYQALRVRMDYRTAIVGAPVGISWQALVEDLYQEPHRGPNLPNPGREAVRRICAWLVRAGLVELRSNAMQAQLLLRLPLAHTLSHAQKKPDRNPTGKPDRLAAEALSTETRPTDRPQTRQTSGYRGRADTGAAAATGGYSEIDPAELVFPPGATPGQQRAYGAIGRKHQLTRDQLQLLFDELAGIERAKGAVRNGAALLDRLARQLTGGDFYGSRAERERGGGAGLSAEEARFLNEGGRE